MDVNQMADLISSVGFPIVLCGCLLWYIYKAQKMHKEETDKLSEALNNNTIVMEKILTKLER